MLGGQSWAGPGWGGLVRLPFPVIHHCRRGWPGTSAPITHPCQKRHSGEERRWTPAAIILSPPPPSKNPTNAPVPLTLQLRDGQNNKASKISANFDTTEIFSLWEKQNTFFFTTIVKLHYPTDSGESLMQLIVLYTT